MLRDGFATRQLRLKPSQQPRSFWRGHLVMAATQRNGEAVVASCRCLIPSARRAQLIGSCLRAYDRRTSWSKDFGSNHELVLSISGLGWECS